MSLCSYVLITTHTKGNLFSPCVFRTENIGGVAASRGGWRIAPYVGMSINPSVTYVTAPLSLRAEEQKYTTRHANNMFLMFLCLNKFYVYVRAKPRRGC